MQTGQATGNSRLLNWPYYLLWQAEFIPAEQFCNQVGRHASAIWVTLI